MPSCGRGACPAAGLALSHYNSRSDSGTSTADSALSAAAAHRNGITLSGERVSCDQITVTSGVVSPRVKRSGRKGVRSISLLAPVISAASIRPTAGACMNP